MGAQAAWAAVGHQGPQLEISWLVSRFAWQNRVLEAIPMGRGARDAYRRAPGDAPPPPRSVGTNLGEEREHESVQKIINS